MDFALTEHQQEIQQGAHIRGIESRRSPRPSIARAAFRREIIDGVADLGLLGCEHDFVAYVAGLIEISKEWASLGASSLFTIRSSAIPSRGLATLIQKKPYLTRLYRAEAARLLCFRRAGGWFRRGSDQDHRRSRRRLVRTERPQALRNERPSGAHRHRLRPHRCIQRAAMGYLPSSSIPALQALRSARPTKCWAFVPAKPLTCFCATAACRQGNLLGGLNQGFAIAREIVEGGRIDIAAQAVGIGEACLAQSIAKAKERKQFGRPIAEFEAIQWMVADMSTEIDAARLLVFRAAAMRAENPENTG